MNRLVRELAAFVGGMLLGLVGVLVYLALGVV